MTTTDSHTYTLGVLYGDGIGPEIVPAAVLIADAAVEAVGAAPIHWRELPLGFKAIEALNEATPKSTLEGLARRTAGCSDRMTARHTRSRSARSSTPAARSASTSICTRMSAPPRRFPAAARSSMALTSSSCGRTPKASTPTAAPTAAPASSCRLPTSPSPWHHHPACMRTDRPRGVRAGARRRKHGDHRAQGERAQDDHGPVPRRLPGSRSGLPGRERGRLPHRRHDGASRAACQRVRRARHREHVRRHPVGPRR